MAWQHPDFSRKPIHSRQPVSVPYQGPPLPHGLSPLHSAELPGPVIEPSNPPKDKAGGGERGDADGKSSNTPPAPAPPRGFAWSETPRECETPLEVEADPEPNERQSASVSLGGGAKLDNEAFDADADADGLRVVASPNFCASWLAEADESP